MEERLDLELPPTGEGILAVLQALSELCNCSDYPQRRVQEIATAAGEALTNAMEHASSDVADPPIRLRAWRELDEIIVEVGDSGPGFSAVPPLPDLERKLEGKESPRGWGIFLMRSLASEVAFLRLSRGHCTRMRFGRTRPPAPVQARIVEGSDVA